jgi:NAD(P)-dependent dehydrogenase (short-subunit alcohol dehydrogenase family)
MSIRFDGKIALITGRAMGIGGATAQKLCSLGSAVAILNRNRDAGQATADALSRGKRDSERRGFQSENSDHRGQF